jgi:hypothetical protein
VASAVNNTAPERRWGVAVLLTLVWVGVLIAGVWVIHKANHPDDGLIFSGDPYNPTPHLLIVLLAGLGLTVVIGAFAWCAEAGPRSKRPTPAPSSPPDGSY